jgi:hypothetical protein
MANVPKQSPKKTQSVTPLGQAISLGLPFLIILIFCGIPSLPVGIVSILASDKVRLVLLLLLSISIVAATVWVLKSVLAAGRPAKQVRSVTLNSGSLKMVDEIVNGWLEPQGGMTVSSWSLLQNASPVRFKAQVSKNTHSKAKRRSIRIDVQYGLLQRGRLMCNVNELPNNRIRLDFHWDGSEQALHAARSDDYRLLNYLLELIEIEFLALGCQFPGAALSGIKISPSGLSPQEIIKNLTRMQGRPGESNAWWRSYTEDVDIKAQSAVAWPSPQDFCEAIQNPHISFPDKDLNQSLPALSSLGLPSVSTGAFASVFKLSKGDEQWAVRCFNSRPTDQHERYQAISRFVLTDDLSYTVDFNYLTAGIKCNGVCFPVLKMNWVNGTPLDAYVRDNIGASDKLHRLRSEFQTMMRELRKNGIAHGDLQHGNILVDQDSLYLVDYDGMYVPELQGRQSNELGHRNYQHPRREAKHFGPYLDNFAAWLIDTSLLCLIEDPSLWKQFVGGDECLLFRHEDLVSPADSKLFQFLRTHRSEVIRGAAARFESLLSKPVEDVPYLSDDAVLLMYSAESLMRQAD